MGTDWEGEENSKPSYGIESRGWAAHKSFIFVSMTPSYDLEHPAKKTFHWRKKNHQPTNFSAHSQLVRSAGFYFFACQGRGLMEWYLFHTNGEELKG